MVFDKTVQALMVEEGMSCWTQVVFAVAMQCHVCFEKRFELVSKATGWSGLGEVLRRHPAIGLVGNSKHWTTGGHYCKILQMIVVSSSDSCELVITYDYIEPCFHSKSIRSTIVPAATCCKLM